MVPGESAIGNGSINLSAVNDVPVATSNTVIASEDVPLIIGAGDFSFSDVESDSLVSVTITGLNLNGGTLTHSGGLTTVTNGMTVTAAQLADLTFTSALNDSTNSSFDYTVNDAGSGTVSSTMNITVNAVNDVPVATGNTVIASEDVPLIIGPGDFSFSDVESDSLVSVTISGLNLNGGTLTHTGGTVPVTNGMTLTAAQLADLTFTSASNDSTNSSFDYTVNDAGAGTVSSTMNITVNAVNDVPVATGNTVIASEDVPLVIGAGDFSFTDVESDSLVSVSISALNLNGGALTHTGGTVPVTNGMTITAAQLADLTFTSASNDSTNSSFDYTVNDAGAGTVSATMNITVNAVNDVPVATGNTVIASEDVPLIIGAGDFSFTDVESDSLVSITISNLNLNGGTLTHCGGLTTVTNGMTVTAAQLADLTFTSALNDSTNSSFDYTVNDAGSGTVSSTMSITVNSVNDVPVATGNTVVASEDVPLVIGAGDFSFTDVESDSLMSVTISNLNLNGGTLTHTGGTVNVTNGMTITAAQLADLTFTSALNDSTSSSFDYTVNDAGSGTVSSTMNITVNAVNDVPVATGNTVIASEDVPLVIGAGDFSFSDVESDSLVSVTISNLSLNGGTLTHTGGTVNVTNGMTISAAELADLTFTSALNDNTNSSFDYTVNDAGLGTVASTMNITVNAVNDSPVLAFPISNQLATEDTLFSFIFAANSFSDADVADSLTYSATLTGGGALPGWINFDGLSRTFSGTPLNADVGTVSVVVSADDGNGSALATSSFDIVIINSDDAPVLINPISNQAASEGNLFSFSFAADTFSDVDASDTLSYSATLSDGSPLPAWLGFDETSRTFSGTPLNDDVGILSVMVTADDGNGGAVATEGFDIVISNVNNSPLVTNLNSTTNYIEGDTDVSITNVVVLSDVDVDEIITATLILDNATIGSLSANDGASYDSLTEVWTITGSVSTVNTALANLLFNPDTDNDLNTTISVIIDDGDEDGSGTLSGTINLNVTAVNDAPSAVNLSSSSIYNQGESSVPLNAIVITEIDSSETVTVTLTQANPNSGSLSANNGASYDAARGVWTMTGTVDEVNLALANISFTPSPLNVLDTTISVSIDDGDEDNTGPLIGALTIKVNPTPSSDVVLVQSEPAPEILTKQAVEESAEEKVEPEADPQAQATSPQEDVVEVVRLNNSAGLAVSFIPDELVEAEDLSVNINLLNKPEAIQIKDSSEPSVARLREQFSELNDYSLQLANTESFITKLNDLREQLVQEGKNTEKVVGGSLMVSAGFSVGYVVWLARSGILLSSVLTSMPAWRFIDLLPILGSLNFKDEEEDKESLESMVEEKKPDV